MPGEPPLIVTALLDQGAFDWFDDLRRTHYPQARNRVPAHLTLFHGLPGDQESAVAEILTAACRGRGPIRLEARGPWFLGQGVAYRIGSTDLEALRRQLATAFDPWLTAQDRAPFRPHVTVQNKVEPEEARRLLERLQLEFEPFEVWAEGLLVWRYLRRRWESVAQLPFDAR